MTRAAVAERAGRDEGAAAVDPRIEQRRRQVAADRRRRRARRALVVPVAATVLAAGWAVTRSAALDVDELVVVGAERTSVDDVTTASGVRPGDALVDVDPTAVAAAVEALPWVREATVERRWRDGAVAVTLEERAPAAQVAAGEVRLLVDASGRVLAEVPAPGVEGLMTLDGVAPADPGQALQPDAAEPLAAAVALTPGVASRVTAVRPGPVGVQLDLAPAGTAVLGSVEDLDEKVRTLQTVFAEVQLDCLATVDVRVPDTAVLTREASCR